MADNLNQPLFYTAYEAAVLELLQALYPHVNYIELVFCVLFNNVPADQLSLNWYTILIIDFAGTLFGPPGQRNNNRSKLNIQYSVLLTSRKLIENAIFIVDQ